MPYRSGSDGGDLYEESEDLTIRVCVKKIAASVYKRRIFLYTDAVDRKEITRGTLYFKDPLVILIFKSCFILVCHNGRVKIRS